LQSIQTAQKGEVLTFTICFRNDSPGVCFKLLVSVAVVTKKIRKVAKELYY